MPDFTTRKQLLKDNYTSKGLIPSSQINRMSRMLNNISGENGIDVTVNTSGIKIKGNPSGTPDQYHLQITANSSATIATIEVHGGSWIRWVGGYDPVFGINKNVQMKDDDGNHDGQWANVATLTITDGFAYIYAELDDAYNPTEFEIKQMPIYPPDTVGFSHNKILCLGAVTTDYAANGGGETYVSNIEQFWSGGDYVDNLEYSLDSCTINTFVDDDGYNTVRKQIYEWNNASSNQSVILNDDLFIKKGVGDCVQYVTWANLKSDLYVDENFCEKVEACVYGQGNSACEWLTGLFGECDICGYIEANCDLSQMHSGLTDISTGTCGDHHKVDYPNPGDNNYSYIGNDGGYGRNNMASGLGDDNGNKSVAVDDRDLADSSEEITLSWENRQLKFDYWTVECATDITPGTDATGALIIAGGVSVAKQFQCNNLYMQADEENNQWTTSHFRVKPATAILELAPDITISNEAYPSASFKGLHVVSATTELFGAATNLNSTGDMTFTIGGTCKVSSSTTQTVLSNVNIMQDDGTLIPIAIRQGWIINP